MGEFAHPNQNGIPFNAEVPKWVVNSPIPKLGSQNGVDPGPPRGLGPRLRAASDRRLSESAGRPRRSGGATTGPPDAGWFGFFSAGRGVEGKLGDV